MNKFIITPWGGRPIFTRVVLLCLATFDMVKAIITFLSLGNVTWAHNYWGIGEWAWEKLVALDDDCPDCMTEQKIKDKLREFERAGASPEEVMQWFHDQGFEATMSPIYPSSPDKKDEVFH